MHHLFLILYYWAIVGYVTCSIGLVLLSLAVTSFLGSAQIESKFNFLQKDSITREAVALVFFVTAGPLAMLFLLFMIIRDTAKKVALYYRPF